MPDHSLLKEYRCCHEQLKSPTSQRVMACVGPDFFWIAKSRIDLLFGQQFLRLARPCPVHTLAKSNIERAEGILIRSHPCLSALHRGSQRWRYNVYVLLESDG